MTTLLLQEKEEAPSDRNAQFRQAIALHKQGKCAEAAESYRDLVLHNPNDALSWCNLGVALRQLQKVPAAAAALRRAIELRPQESDYLLNYGNLLVELNSLERALPILASAVRLAPDTCYIRRAYGFALHIAGHCEEAIVEFEQALALEPNDVESRWGRTVSLLKLGRLRDGWRDFELRWRREGRSQPQFTVPLWRGEDLTNKTMCLYGEQGFGDTILFSRYIPLVKARGARIVLACRAPLHRLFQSIPGIDRIIDGNADERLHYHSPLMSLPGAFGTDLNTIPPPSPLSAGTPAPKVNDLLDHAKDRFRVGIVWSGNVDFVDNHQRSVALKSFLSLAEIPGIQLYSLQKGPPEKDVMDCGAQGLILELGPHLNDFADTAAVVNQLDLVIMTDSAVAHLAGSLGRPIWNLLSYSPYWLYMQNRDDTPWYSSMRLFRQPKPGDWDAVFNNVALELEKAVHLKRSGAWPQPKA